MRALSAQHGAQLWRQAEQQGLTRPGPEPGVAQRLTELDGSLIPLVATAAAPDKRRHKRLYWGEARLCLARAVRVVTPRFGATLGAAPEAGLVWSDCVKRAGAGSQTRLHCVGDGAKWIIEQAQEGFGAQADYLLDFSHVSEYLARAGAVSAGPQVGGWLHQQQEL